MAMMARTGPFHTGRMRMSTVEQNTIYESRYKWYSINSIILFFLNIQLEGCSGTFSSRLLEVMVQQKRLTKVLRLDWLWYDIVYQSLLGL